MVWLDDIGRSAQQAGAMLWLTLWPLLLGFSLSGCVQAFATPSRLQHRLGTHRPRAVLWASGYGMASSSCSYAATATARSLFAHGADFVSSVVFMFASTNLVIEMGIVLVALMGWQFAAGEFVGGSMMIVLLAAGGGWWLLRGRSGQHLAELQPAKSGSPADATEPSSAVGPVRHGVADAMRFTLADLKMVRREVLVGFAVAGVLATVVPTSLWNDFFLHGHGVWTSAENALVGPIIAMMSFTCSIGNVALAVALWKGGIAFSGVISFLFGDLLALPLIAIYRRYYGTRLTLRLVLLFWVTMSTAGFLTGQLFDGLGWSTASRHLIRTTWTGWGATTWLNLLVVAIFAWCFIATKKRRAESALVTDPMCGMQVRPGATVARSEHDGAVTYFCSDRCRTRFEADGAELAQSARL